MDRGPIHAVGRESLAAAGRGESSTPQPALRAAPDPSAVLEPFERFAEALVVDAEHRTQCGAGEGLGSGREAVEDELVEVVRGPFGAKECTRRQAASPP